MKKTLLRSAFAIVLLSPACLSAQVMGFAEPIVDFGVKAGANFMTISNAPVTTGPGVLAGAWVRKSISNKFGVKLEALGTFRNYSTKHPASFYSYYTPGMDTISKGSFDAISVNVPVLLEYKINGALSVHAGVQYNYILSLSDKNGAFTKIYGEDHFINMTDLSIAAGVELKLGKNWEAGARLLKGLNDINNSTYYLTSKPWRMSGVQLSLSYKIIG